MSGSPDRPLSCALRKEVEDFQVEEVPLYEPCGEGEHTFVQIEKRELSTPHAKRLLSERLGVAVRDIGHAGLKDARSVSRQWLSLPGIEPAKLEGLQAPGLVVLRAARHRHKLKVGHLAGNVFTLVLRELSEEDASLLTTRLEVVAGTGFPNRFMEQRFGRRGENVPLGRLLAQGDEEGFRAEARRTGLRRPTRALKGLLFSAWQAHVFNRLLERREEQPGGLAEPLLGDVVQKHDSGGMFEVEDLAEVVPRARALELSPTGPLPGPRARSASGVPGELERAVLEEEGIEEARWRGPGHTGTRRSLRALAQDVSLEPMEREDAVRISFRLAPGTFATALVDHLTLGGAAGWGTQAPSGASDRDPGEDLQEGPISCR